MYLYHPRVIFFVGYGWFEVKILYFNTQIRTYHILVTDRTTGYVSTEDSDEIYLILL